MLDKVFSSIVISHFTTLCIINIVRYIVVVVVVVVVAEGWAIERSALRLGKSIGKGEFGGKLVLLQVHCSTK